MVVHRDVEAAPQQFEPVGLKGRWDAASACQGQCDVRDSSAGPVGAAGRDAPGLPAKLRRFDHPIDYFGAAQSVIATAGAGRWRERRAPLPATAVCAYWIL
jgi:hypothetical protein